MEENITEMMTPEVPQEIPAEEPVFVPEAVSEEEAPAEQIPQEEAPKPKKKLNKKLLIIGVAAVLIIALAIGLVSLLGGGTKNTGVFIKEGELFVYVDGMKEPLELTSRLWKDAEDNLQFAKRGPSFVGSVQVRNNGQLVFYPDKYSYEDSGYTIFLKNLNKPKEDAVKIDSDITSYSVTEDGSKMLYLKRDGSSYSLHLYDVKNEEETRLAKDVPTFDCVDCTDDFSTICFISDGDLYLWTAENEDVRIAKDVNYCRYEPETGVVFAKTADGELMMKTADMEECEEVAEDVFSLLASYPTGEAYFLRVVETERCLLDYLDDDMAAEDAAHTQPKKPTYPTAPQRVYYWNYATDEEYQKAKAQYDADYAAYLEKYNSMKEEYNNALELYSMKQHRDGIRASLEERFMEREEYVLYYFDGSEEHLLADSLVTNSFKSRSTKEAVLVYNAYTPGELVKPKLSEIEDKWAAATLVQQAITDALYNENEFYLVQGGKTTVIEQTAASDFRISGDATAVYFLDAPFVAYDDKNDSYADAPVAEAPAAEYPAAEYPAATEPGAEDEEEGETLIPKNQREYASLYCISLTDGEAGAPELVDSDVSLYFPPRIGADASQLTYAKNVDEEELSGELYVAGQLISDDAYLNYRWFLDEHILFITDWDTDDNSGTLCMMKLGDEKAEVVEIADDVYAVSITENNDVFYLQDFNEKRYEGTLFLYDVSKGKAKEIADDVTYVG